MNTMFKGHNHGYSFNVKLSIIKLLKHLNYVKWEKHDADG